jgi:hypothetical protein
MSKPESPIDRFAVYVCRIRTDYPEADGLCGASRKAEVQFAAR